MIQPDFSKGLVPAIIIDYETKDVLMLAYMNEESYQKTLESGETWFYSRSRKGLWHKGETSGYLQKVKSIHLDCDQDTLLIAVDQIGVACHTGSRSCFFQEVRSVKSMDSLKTLYEEIASRKKAPKEGSYTNYLFTKGLDKILKKVGEETTEVVIAAKNHNQAELIAESADLLYHLSVMWVEQEIQLEDLAHELAKRQGKISKTQDRQTITKY